MDKAKAIALSLGAVCFLGVSNGLATTEATSQGNTVNQQSGARPGLDDTTARGQEKSMEQPMEKTMERPEARKESPHKGAAAGTSKDLSGTIVSVEEEALAGSADQNLIVYLNAGSDQQRVPVSLGKTGQVDKAKFEEGKRISVTGTMQTFEGKNYLMAERVEVDGETIRVTQTGQQARDSKDQETSRQKRAE